MQKGAYTIGSLAMLAILFVIAAVTISVGAEITQNIREEICADNGTYGTYTNSSATNPETSNYIGCCASVNASDSNDCDVWQTANSALNVSYQGLEGLNTMGEWLPTLAIVIMAGVVIGILLTSFRFKGGA